MKRSHVVRDQRGNAVVEFTLVFPLLFMVLLGSLSVLWMLAARSTMTGAARDGARYASIRFDPYDCDLDCDGEFPAEIFEYPTEAQVTDFVNERVGMFGSVTVQVHPDEAEDEDGNLPGEDLTPAARSLARTPNSPISVTVSRPLPIIFTPIASLLGWNDLTYTSDAKVRAE